MATIDDLAKSITQMTREELEALIIKNRKNLRTKVETKKAKTVRIASEKKEEKSLTSLINGLTNEQKAQLLEELGAM
jgi:hypothetical protein